MKRPASPPLPERRLKVSELRAIERELGVYFVDPVSPTRRQGFEEQYGVLDEDEEYAGDIRAGRVDCFTRESLVAEVRYLFTDRSQTPSPAEGPESGPASPEPGPTSPTEEPVSSVAASAVQGA
jgi:hypothetical protein